jgi:hypothetical protein
MQTGPDVGIGERRHSGPKPQLTAARAGNHQSDYKTHEEQDSERCRKNLATLQRGPGSPHFVVSLGFTFAIIAPGAVLHRAQKRAMLAIANPGLRIGKAALF